MGENSTCKTVTAVIIVLLLLAAGVIIAYFATNHFGMGNNDDSTPQKLLTPSECGALNGTMYNGYCYTNTDLLLSWPDAQAYCANAAPTGSLASILSVGDNNWVSSMAFNRSFSQSLAWFGLNDQAQQGSFVFVRDGTVLTSGSFTSWVSDSSPGAPLTDPDASFQSCATMEQNPLGLWRMSICSELHIFVCQYKLASTPDAPGTPVAEAAVGAALVSFAAPDTDGGDTITMYTVISNPGNIIANGTASPIAVHGLTVDVSYNFRVYASNGVGDGPLSPPSNNVVPFASVPDAPVIGIAIPGSGAASVSFTPPAFDGLSTITSYHLKTYASADTSTVLSGSAFTAQATSSPIVISTLTNGQSYSFRVYAVNDKGNSIDSDISNSITPAAGVPTQPLGVVATALNRAASVTFSPPFSNGGNPVLFYTIYVYLVGTASAGPVGNVTSAVAGTVHIPNLVVGSSYVFTVVATSVTGDSLASAVSNSVLVFAIVPTAPVASGASAGGARAMVSFMPPSDDGGAAVSSYLINATDSTGAWSVYYFDALVLAAASAPPFIADVKPLTPGESYSFTVLAVNAVGRSMPSNSVGPVVPIVTAPDAPFGVVAVAASRSAVVTWQQPHNGGDTITSYSVYIHPGSMVVTGLTGLNATIANLTAASLYNFTVVAINSHGPSAESLLSNTVVPFASAPSKPFYISATPLPLSAEVYFSPPADDGGSPILYYYIKTTPARETMGGTLPSGWNRGTSSPITVTSLLPVSYQFQIVAHNLYGDSPPSDLPVNSVAVGVGTPDAPTQVFATDDGGSNVKVFFDEPLFDGGDPIQNYTVTSNPGGIRVTTLTSPALFTGLPDGTYRFIAYATNNIGNSVPSLQSNAVTITSSSPQLLALWIVLGILGFIGLLVALYFLRRCLLVQKNRNHDKISKQTNTNDNEMVIVKDESGKTGKTGSDLEEGGTDGDTLKTTGQTTSADPDDESNWVSH